MQALQMSFTPDDLELLVKVNSFVPELEVLAHLAKLARSRLSFPITNYEGLLPLFQAESQVFETSQRRLTFNSTQKFFPTNFFPIVSEDDFLTKAYVAIWMGYHSHSKIPALPIKYIMDKMEIPEDAILINPVLPIPES